MTERSTDMFPDGFRQYVLDSYEAQRVQRVEYRNPFCDKPIDEHWTPTGEGLQDSLLHYARFYDLRWQDIETGRWEFRRADYLSDNTTS